MTESKWNNLHTMIVQILEILFVDLIGNRQSVVGGNSSETQGQISLALRQSIGVAEVAL